MIELVVKTSPLVSGGWIAVQEQAPGTRIPAFCPNRHMNGDETFCIGFNSQTYVTNQNRAHVWWGLLKEFLLLQRYADKTGRWPPHKELSHGLVAGTHHMAAKAAAEVLGIGDEYNNMLMGQEAWFSSGEFKIDEDNTLQAARPRPCPVTSCTSEEGVVDYRLCPHVELATKLVRHEHLRRKADHDFWLGCVDEPCCGTMVTCPLPELKTQQEKAGLVA